MVILDHHARSVSKQVGGVDGAHNMTGVEDDGTCLPSNNRGLTVDDDTVDLVFRRLHPDDAYIANIIKSTYRLIANKGASDNHTTGICWDNEVACLIAQSAADKRGIGRAE